MILKKIKILVISLLFIFSSQSILKAQEHSNWSYNLSIYEVNTRQFTSSGSFQQFSEHLNRLKEMGVGIIWFMPIHPIGLINRKGSLGSPYSVKDYYGINPEFGTLSEFKSLVDSIHAKGMHVIIDWVANHTAWDNSLTALHPEWYVKDANGNFIPPPGTDWTDVIQLDYSKPELRNYMIQAMSYWVSEVGIDGFRCDAAGFVPSDFWSAAITQLKSLKPDLFMLAEDDSPLYQNLGFDMTYAWGLYGFGNGVLSRIYNGTGNANNLSSYLVQEQNNFSPNHYRMYFTSNHDENSWNGTVFERFGDAAESFAVLTLTIGGMPLIYGGQESGLNKRLLFFDKDEIIWQPHPFANIYKTLIELKKTNHSLWNGSKGGIWQKVNTTNNSKIFAFVREKDTDKIFAVFNLSPGFDGATILDSLYYGTYVDIFSNDTTTFNHESSIALNAWKYKIFKKITISTSVENDIKIITNFVLNQNYPNPFNPVTKIKYSMPKADYVTIKVFDVLGKEVKTLVHGEKKAGNYSVIFDASKLTSGVYFYTMKAGNFLNMKKMILLK